MSASHSSTFVQLSAYQMFDVLYTKKSANMRKITKVSYGISRHVHDRCLRLRSVYSVYNFNTVRCVELLEMCMQRVRQRTWYTADNTIYLS